MLRGGCTRSGRTMPARRPSRSPTRAGTRLRWRWLLAFPLVWAAAPADAQAPAFLVRDINAVPGAVESSSPQLLVQVGTTTFFTAWTPQTGRELWRSDGTEAGTTLVKDILPGPDGSSPTWLVDVNGTVFFVVGTALWKSDGTRAGTVRVKEIGRSMGPGLVSLAAVN